jgi:putative tryptophan/tyrosine transport system substrate-binding protein
MSTRRAFIAGLGAAAAWTLAVRAQHQEGVRRVAVVVGISENDPESQARLAGLRRGLMAAGWVEGQNLYLDYYFASGSIELVQSVVAEVVRSRPEVIVANGTFVVATLKPATQAIPIVGVAINDPIELGFIESYARPGGSITGFTFTEPELIGKWLSLLTDISPAIKRSALLFNPTTTPYYPAYLRSFEATRPVGSAKVSAAPVTSSEEIESVVAGLAREPGGSLIASADPFNAVHRATILEATQRHALPAISAYRQLTREGGLVSYAPDFADIFERSAGYVDRILKGENPADLPVQTPTKFEMAVNLKTAKALGLTVPAILQATADEVIE